MLGVNLWLRGQSAFSFISLQHVPAVAVKKHLHRHSIIRLAWLDFDKLEIFIKNECASSIQRTGTVSPDAKWLNRPLDDVSSIMILYSIFGS